MTEMNHSFLLDSQILATDFVPDGRVALSLRATVEDQEEEMRQLDTTISNLETQLDELRAHRVEVQRSYNLRKGLLAPIRKLPPETLGEIFLHCVPDSQISLNDAPLLLMQVCRRWRRVTSGTSCLWTRLYLSPGCGFHPCYIIRMWLSHSGTLPISITINHMGWDISVAIRLIVQNFHRFRHFTTSFLTEDLCDELRQGAPTHAPLLESFTVRDATLYVNLETRISQLDGCILAPKLTAVSLPHTLLMNLMVFHPMSLTSITLETDESVEIPPSLQFLTTCRNIRSLELTFGGAGSFLFPNIDGQPRILLPFLENLTIIDFWCWYDPCSFLQTIEVPALRELTIEGHGDPDDDDDDDDDEAVLLLPVILDSLLKEGSPLERLHLCRVDLMDGPPFVSMLRKSHDLHSLTLTSSKVNNSILKALTPDASSPLHSWMCPSLSALDVSGVRSVDLILALIRNRAPIDLEDTSTSAATSAGYLRYVNVGTDREPSCIATLEEIKDLCHGLLEIGYAKSSA